MTALEIVKRYYDNFNNKNWQGMMELLSDDIKHDANQGETYYGKENFAKFLQKMDECYEEELKDLVLFQATLTERIAAEFTVSGYYKKTDGDLPPAKNQHYILPADAFLEVQNGKITRITTYYNLPLWISLVSA